MCGIAGLFECNANYDVDRIATSMAAQIALRGPDSDDCWSDKGVGIARLRSHGIAKEANGLVPEEKNGNDGEPHERLGRRAGNGDDGRHQDDGHQRSHETGKAESEVQFGEFDLRLLLAIQHPAEVEHHHRK